MPKAGERIVCVLDEVEQEEWCRRVNAAVEAVALDFIGRSLGKDGTNIDITKVSELDPKELCLQLDDKRVVLGVEIDFFLER